MHGARRFGPADLALNILLAATDDRNFAANWHQHFNRDIIASLLASEGMNPAATGPGLGRAESRDWRGSEQVSGIRHSYSRRKISRRRVEALLRNQFSREIEARRDKVPD